MAIGSKLGAAYVTVQADVKGFGAGLTAQLKASMVGAEEYGHAAGRGIGEKLVDGILAGIAYRLPMVRARIEAMLRGIDASTRARIHVEIDAEGDMFWEVEDAFDRVEDAGRRMQRNVENIGGRTLGRLASVVAGMSSKAGDAISRIGSVMGTAKGNAVTLAIQIELVYFVAMAAVDAFMAVGRELLNVVSLVGLLPAGLTAVAAVAATLAIGFQGVGKAIEEALTGTDPKKLAEAMEGLSKSAKNFVNDLRAARPELTKIGDDIQESIFSKLTNVVPQLLAKLGPTLSGGMQNLGAMIGTGMSKLVDTLTSPKAISFLGKLFDVLQRLGPALGGPALRILDALIGVGEKSLPALERFGLAVGRVLDQFADWLNKVTENGDLNKWLNEGIETIGDLKDLVKELANLFGVLFDDANNEGKTFIEQLTDMIRSIREFAASPEGKLAFEGLAAAGNAAWHIFVAIVTVIGGIIAALGSFVGAVIRAVNWIESLLGVIGRLKAANINSAVGAAASAAARAARGIAGYASGTITTGPELAMIGESGREVVVPLNDPARARQLADASGLTSMLGSGGGGVSVAVYIGDEQLDARMTRVVARSTSRSTRTATYQGFAAAAA